MKVLFQIILSILMYTQCVSALRLSSTRDAGFLQIQSISIGDSSRLISKQEQRKKLNAALKHVTLTHKKLKPKDVNERIVNAEYATFKLLLIIGRAIDRPGTFGQEMNEQEVRFTESDKKSTQVANKMVNGFTSMYAMYAMYAHMYAQSPDKQKLKKEIEEIEEGVKSKMHSKITAMEIVTSMAGASYKLLAIMLQQADTSGVFAESIENIKKGYLEGDKVSESDEDRFLNGIFRTFEVSQIWAFATDPLSKENINKLLTECITKSRTAEQISEQIAVALEYLYSITHIIAEGYVKRI